MYVIVLKQLIIMSLIAVLGFAVTKAFKFGKTEQSFVSRLLLYVINPCMILHTFNVPYSEQRFHELLVVILISLAAHVSLTLLALLFFHSRTQEEKKLDAIDKLSVVFTNCAFIGIPLINGVFGPSGTFYLMGYVAVFNIFLWTIGYYMAVGKMRPLKVITNPNVLAVFAGIIIFCIPKELPEIADAPLKFVGDMNTATSMLLLGMLFATFRKPETSMRTYIMRVAKVSALRLVLSAVIMFFIAWGAVHVFSGMQNIRLMSYVVFIAALCPVGMSVSSFAVVFGADESYSSMIVSITSVLCLLTLPMSVAVAEKFF